MTFLRSAPIDVEWLNQHDWWTHVQTGGPEECWQWTQSTASHGYGQTWDGTTVRLAHRVAWTLTHGAIPLDMTIDHVCRHRLCCNPAHLRLLTNHENASDNGPARRTHCPRGHEYDAENTYRDPTGGRRCRSCARLLDIERRRVA